MFGDNKNFPLDEKALGEVTLARLVIGSIAGTAMLFMVIIPGLCWVVLLMQ